MILPSIFRHGPLQCFVEAAREGKIDPPRAYSFGLKFIIEFEYYQPDLKRIIKTHHRIPNNVGKEGETDVG